MTLHDGVLRRYYITSCDNLRLVITVFRPTETLTSKVISSLPWGWGFIEVIAMSETYFRWPRIVYSKYILVTNSSKQGKLRSMTRKIVLIVGKVGRNKHEGER